MLRFREEPMPWGRFFRALAIFMVLSMYIGKCAIDMDRRCEDRSVPVPCCLGEGILWPWLILSGQ